MSTDEVEVAGSQINTGKSRGRSCLSPQTYVITFSSSSGEEWSSIIAGQHVTWCCLVLEKDMAEGDLMPSQGERPNEDKPSFLFLGGTDASSHGCHSVLIESWYNVYIFLCRYQRWSEFFVPTIFLELQKASLVVPGNWGKVLNLKTHTTNTISASPNHKDSNQSFLLRIAPNSAKLWAIEQSTN